MKKLIILALFILTIFCFIYTLNDKYTVTFNTDGGSKISDLKVKKGHTLTLPNDPIKKDYVFIEWQLNGRRFNDNTRINKNIELKAKYVKEATVKVTFDSMGGTSIPSVEVIVGDKVDKKKIKEPVKDGYEFSGWYLGEQKFDFNQNITSSIMLNAHYKLEKKELKVGDFVLIIGSYASSTYDDYGYHKKAIGWIRQILYIYDGAKFPYQVGLGDETTGFFQDSSLQLVDTN